MSNLLYISIYQKGNEGFNKEKIKRKLNLREREGERERKKKNIFLKIPMI